ncbi:FAD-binding protein [Burkholderia vietnamiensis]|uniref:FAD-binding protein n=1 Tax=Burkholderia vietnamiensis TaxID=60552 RepID=UPI001B9E3B72|nr:FAD-binding protein [Burkholderia vietnamiensis]MBR8229826.1 FAD-binding protein [Burkholderia vietnamiensis]
MIRVDVAIIGGGLAGMLAAVRLGNEGKRVAIIDQNLIESHGSLGGFASFSGAKFSLPPAGLGLLSVVDGLETLNAKICHVLQVLELDRHPRLASTEHSSDGEIELGTGTVLRRYESLLLSPDEISDLVARLATRVSEKCTVVQGLASSLQQVESDWNVKVEAASSSDSHDIRASAVFFAGGRAASDLLLSAGALPFSGKGLDVGVRFEFLNRAGVNGLRALGADAKIIRERCRTFCLNSPGTIYRYPFKDISIPGGVVAIEPEQKANFGVLLRIDDKQRNLTEIVDKAASFWSAILASGDEIHNGVPFDALASLLSKVWGREITLELEDFCRTLEKLELVDWSSPYRVHSPLIDWHWHTFSGPGSHITSLPHVYALGDASGHARGLLQAALSGWIAAEEFLNA